MKSKQHNIRCEKQKSCYWKQFGIVVAGFGLFLVALPVPVPAVECPVISMYQITFDTADQIFPSVWGDKIVWTDYRNDPAKTWTGNGKGNPDIYLYNLTSGTEVQLTSEEHAQSNPRIWGNIVVWEDYRHGNADIYMYDLGPDGKKGTADDGGEQPVTIEPHAQLEPALWNDKIVWRDFRTNPAYLNGTIFLYDLKTKKEYRLSNCSAAQRQPAIFENRVVWVDFRDSPPKPEYAPLDENTTIILYDLGQDGLKSADDREVKLSFLSKDDLFPAIYGNTVVWLNVNGTYCDLVYYDLLTGTYTVARNAARSARTAVWGNRALWTQVRNGYDVLIGTNIVDNTDVFSDNVRGSQLNPSISGNVVVWQGWQNGNWDIFAYRFSAPANTPPKILSTRSEPVELLTDGSGRFTGTIKFKAEIEDCEANIRSVRIDLSPLGLDVRELKPRQKTSSKVWNFELIQELSHPLTVGKKNLTLTVTDFENVSTKTHLEIVVSSKYLIVGWQWFFAGIMICVLMLASGYIIIRICRPHRKKKT